MHSLIPKCIEMCFLIENALLNLLNVPLMINYLSKHSLLNCLPVYVYSDVGGVMSSIYTFNAKCGIVTCTCGTWRVKMCSLNKSWGPWDTSDRSGYQWLKDIQLLLGLHTLKSFLKYAIYLHMVGTGLEKSLKIVKKCSNI